MKRKFHGFLLMIFFFSISFVLSGCENITGKEFSYGDGKDNEARLDNLEITPGEFNYTFNPNDWDYEVTVSGEVETVTVRPVLRHIFAQCTLSTDDSDEETPVSSGTASDPIPVKTGHTVITITVTAWDGSINTYTITVTRLLSDNADLESLAIQAGVDSDSLENVSFNEGFDPATNNYSAFVHFSATFLSIDAKADEGTFQVEQSGVGIIDDENLDAISLLNQGVNRFTITVTAPDEITRKHYTVQVTRLSGDPGDSRVTNLYIEKTTLHSMEDGSPFNGTKWTPAPDAIHYQWTGTANEKIFEAEISIGKLDPGDDSVETNLVIVTQSTAARAAITVDGETTTVTGTSVSSGMLKFELTGSDFPTKAESYAIDVSVLPGDGNAAYENRFTINLIVSPGNNDAALSDLKVQWGANNSERIAYHGSFNNGSTGTMGHNPSDTDYFGFQSHVHHYLAVMHSTETARLVLKPSDPNIIQIKITEDTAGVGTVETIKEGGSAVTHNVNLTKGLVTDVEIEITAEDGSTAMTYDIDIKLLNVFEYYWGIYQPLNIKSFARWEDKFGSKGVKSVDIPGIIQGNLDWTVKLSGLKPRNTMTWENNYLDGNRDSSGYSIQTDYCHNHITDNAYNGLVFNGQVSGLLDGISSKNGLVTGDLTLSSPWGDTISITHAHYEVRGGSKTEMASSYAEVDYMDETDVKMPYKYDANANALNPFGDPANHDWRTPWFPGTNGEFGTY